jgi:hypothetical protein
MRCDTSPAPCECLTGLGKLLRRDMLARGRGERMASKVVCRERSPFSCGSRSIPSDIPSIGSGLPALALAPDRSLGSMLKPQ